MSINMRNDFEQLKLRFCPECYSDWLEEVYTSETNEYYIECKHCGKTSDKTMIQEEAAIIWNNIPNPEVDDILEEISYLEEQIKIKNEEIEAIVDDIDCCYQDIEILKKELEKYGRI